MILELSNIHACEYVEPKTCDRYSHYLFQLYSFFERSSIKSLLHKFERYLRLPFEGDYISRVYGIWLSQVVCRWHPRYTFSLHQRRIQTLRVTRFNFSKIYNKCSCTDKVQIHTLFQSNFCQFLNREPNLNNLGKGHDLLF